uniref:NADH dehydrogenase subunit 6 n=1 Tax=Proasellus parvulus TaxID=1282015 RepID=A0A485M7Y2_9CRUS|nr:NADH dehydrogenase subunit 6 [Proasellus parvulus]
MSLALLMLLTMSSLFLASSAPHILVAALLTSTAVASVLLSSVKPHPWLAYALFLVFLGGVLVLFTYISSLSSNLLFKKVKLEILAPALSLVVLFMSFNKPPTPVESPSNPLMTPFLEMTLKELFSPAAYPLYLYLFMYLLITLLYVVALMKTYYAPLRKTL